MNDISNIYQRLGTADPSKLVFLKNYLLLRTKLQKQCIILSNVSENYDLALQPCLWSHPFYLYGLGILFIDITNTILMVLYIHTATVKIIV